MIKIGINGFGRIGRLVFRAICDQGLLGKEIEVVAVNDIVPADNLAYLLKYDSTQGKFAGTVDQRRSRARASPRTTCSSSTATRSSASPSSEGPAALPWKDLGVDIVIESHRPVHRRREGQGPHRPPARRRSSSPPRPRTRTSPSSWASTTRSTTPAKHNIISNASCTTNCLAPVVHVLLKEGFGIEEGLMTTDPQLHRHAEDRRRPVARRTGRAAARAAINIIPSTTGAAKAVGLAIPEVKGKLTGMAFRVPTPTVSRRRPDREDGEGDQLQGNLRRDEEGQRDVPQGHPRLHRRRGRLDRLHPRHRTRASSTPAAASS